MAEKSKSLSVSDGNAGEPRGHRDREEGPNGRKTGVEEQKKLKTRKRQGKPKAAPMPVTIGTGTSGTTSTQTGAKDDREIRFLRKPQIVAILSAKALEKDPGSAALKGLGKRGREEGGEDETTLRGLISSSGMSKKRQRKTAEERRAGKDPLSRDVPEEERLENDELVNVALKCKPKARHEKAPYALQRTVSKQQTELARAFNTVNKTILEENKQLRASNVELRKHLKILVSMMTATGARSDIGEGKPMTGNESDGSKDAGDNGED